MHIAFGRLALVFVSLATLCSFSLQAAAQPVNGVSASVLAAPLAAAAGEVTFMRDLFGAGQIAAGDKWLIGGGYLYWARCTSPGPSIAAPRAQPAAAQTGYLRRWPVRGGAITTLSNQAFCDSETSSWAADDSGLYYWQNGFLYRRSLANPLTPVAVVSTGGFFVAGALVLDGANVFYIVNNEIYRTPKAQTYSADPQDQDGTLPVVEGGAGATGLIANGGALNWFGGGRVRSVDKTCTVVCSANDLATEPGAYLSNASIASFGTIGSINPLWVSGPIEGASRLAGNQIRSYSCRSNSSGISCGAGTAYAAPNQTYSDGTDRPSAIGPMASDGDYLFWVEDLKICKTDMFGITSCAAGAAGRLMKYRIGRLPISSPPDQFDTPLSIASKDSSGIFSMSGTPPVAVADGWVYFDTSNGLSRIRADAPPLSWDLAFNSWEVTQGIQNLNNDVPLVANKPTFVRVYGSKSSGPDARNVEGILRATAASGAPLGSLRSLNGPQNFTADNATPDRAAANAGWLFQLPDEWTNVGVTKLSFQVDPRAVLNDPNRGNNNVSDQAFSFSQRAPICLVTIPVRTHAPAASNSDPSLYRMADIVRQMMPTSDVWLYHQNNDVAQIEARFGIPPWKYEPYAVPTEGENILNALGTREDFTDDPDRCDDVNAITHYVGLVAAETNTSNDEGENYGLGRRPGSSLYVKLINGATLNATPQFWQVQRFNTLAHELSHNYGRQHVDCGKPKNIDGGYPYRSSSDERGPNCVLDDGQRGGPFPIPAYNRYYGFDTQSMTPIDPGTTADYMSYGAPFWVSDYTWRGVFGRINTPPAVSAAAGQERNGTAQTQAEIAAAATIVYIRGTIDPAVNTGSLNYAWVYPSSALSQGIRSKLQRSAAPQVGNATTQADGVYTLRLRDAAGTLLDERAVTLQSTADGDGTEQAFVLTFPAPATAVAKLELTSGDAVIASLAPGSAAPTVNIISPAGGETIDNSMTLSWRAADTDPTDRLLFNVQYSSDNGQHWRALLSGFPNRSNSDTVTLNLADLSGIPASTTGGLIRIAASDGFNTTLATSQPFTVVNRAPEPVIDAPGSAPLPAGQTIVLNGSATDAEDGGLSGAALQWTLDGTVIGSGQQTIEGLAPGSHTLALTARDSAGKAATATQTLVVAPLAIPKTAVPAFDGNCNDNAYANAAHVPLAPYADGTQGFVSLVRTGDALYACFSGMKRTGTGSPGTLAVVRVDSDYGRRSAPGANDHVFYTNEAGVISTFNGNGTGYVTGSGGAGAQISANGASWNVEMRIDAAAIGGMNHMIGLGVEQALVASDSDRYAWPQESGASNPSSWGAAALGDVPQIGSLTPAGAPAGSGDTLVTITGSSFAPGAVALLNGVALATTVISGTQLHATIPVATLAAAGTLNLTVANPGLTAAPSQASPFSITNPLPRVSQAKLADKTLTIIGSNFAPAATVQFNGSDYAATGSSTQLSITIRDDDLLGSTDALLTVFNPGPGGGVSNVVTLGAGPASNSVYLPLITPG
ncbi:MAG: IPT/TIG domain-containing protein [Roseiflexaceae bacterium]|nr:IPT/TIG domain-containing protein [Roseiflexaceae bacterium]